MGLFDFFKKKQGKSNTIYQQTNSESAISVQEIVNMAQVKEPRDVYEYDSRGRKYLDKAVREAVESIMPNYDGGVMNISAALMLNKPKEMKERIKNSDVDTLLLFFKFLAIEANCAHNKDIIAPVQHFIINVLQDKLS